jgi:succinate dehydrogenase / fumarate reductase cytochrome b subunit
MNWFQQLLTSTLGRKLLMALTGLFLILFLVVHLAGNLQLLAGDGGKSFNIYAHFMSTNGLIKTVSILNFGFILLHVIYSIVLTRYNQRARPTRYAVNQAGSTSSWSSRNMGILGTIIFIFLVVHLKGFWYENKFGKMPVASYAGVGEINDLYTIVNAAYQQWWYTAFYVVSMIFLAFHLSHGFASAFQTLGLNHVKYTPVIKVIGGAFAIVVPLLFAAIPIVMYLKSLA